MVWSSVPLVYFAACFLSSFTAVRAQILTSLSVPPLQWINLTNLLGGTSPPPPLKDASIGYDNTSRSLIIFGGESQGGFVQSQTYLLNLNTLTWSTPSPPSTLHNTPSARSAAVSGCDFAASNRHGFLIIGGKGSDGRGLADVWEYDFNNQFWSEVALTSQGPSARWGSSGGIDIRTVPIQDTLAPGPNNTFYLAGGFDGVTISPLSDIWRLNVSGTLSSNLPNSTVGFWDHLTTIGQLPAKFNQAGTVISHQVVSAGGCDKNLTGVNCPQQDSYVVDTQSGSTISPPPCVAPRLRASLVQNLNAFATGFSSQAFLLLGTFNTSLWQDGGGLEKGEVSVLDINTGTWNRVLPSGDPGTSGIPAFPSPRQGAAAFSYSTALVGQSLSTSSDTIVFGGQDASGKYLSEVWILRAYSGAVSSSNPTWSGFGNGQLQSGPTATGTGVTNQYISQCVAVVPGAASPTHTPAPSASQPNTPTHDHQFDTSVVHKLMGPLSLALSFPAILLFRLVSTPFHSNHDSKRHDIWTYAFVALAIAAYGSGIAGIVASFTSISSSFSNPSSRSSPPKLLRTGHGQAGLALFIGLYAFIPLLALLSVCFRHFRAAAGGDPDEKNEESSERSNSIDARGRTEDQVEPTRTSQRVISPPLVSSPRPRSWGPSSLWQKHKEERLSTDDQSVRSAIPSATPLRTFEVLNRPAHSRQSSGGWPPTLPATKSLHDETTNSEDADLLRPRRSLITVSHQEYDINRANITNAPSTPNTADALMTPGPTLATTTASRKPYFESHSFDVILKGLFHAFLLGLCVLSLMALWSRASRATFAVFLSWTLAFYLTLLLVHVWKGKPMLRAARLSISSDRPSISSAFRSPRSPVSDYRFPFSRGPYVHQPPYRAAFSNDPDDTYHSGGRRSVDGDVEDEDDDSRQRRMEEEMGRRDVSIITVPKHKLWVANPS